MVAVIGIGNPLAGDDGAGIETVRLLKRSICDERVRCMTCERGGLDLLDLIAGYDEVVLVDAAKTGHNAPGAISTARIQRPFPATGSLSLHTIQLQALLGFGTMIGLSMPEAVTVFAIETADPATFHEGCSSVIQQAVVHVVNGIQTHLEGTLGGLRLASAGGTDLEELRGLEHLQH